MNVLTRPWRHIVDYEGRSTRREFWLFILLFYLGLFGLFMLAELIGGPNAESTGARALSLMPLAWGLANLIPFVALAVRRLHDHDKPAWFFILGWFPIFGWMFLLIMMLAPGTEEGNSFGPNPRDGEPVSDTVELA